MSKTQAVLEYLTTGKILTTEIAKEELNINRLPGFIYKLRFDYGYKIESEWKKNKEKDTNYVEYKLILDKKRKNYVL